MGWIWPSGQFVNLSSRISKHLWTLGFPPTPHLPLFPNWVELLKFQHASGLWCLKVKSHLPEGPPVVPGMGPPVFRAEAHGDLEHLRVHHVGYHSQEACEGGAGQGVRKQGGALSTQQGPVSAGESMDPQGRTVSRTETQKTRGRWFSKPAKEFELSPRAKGDPGEM